MKRYILGLLSAAAGLASAVSAAAQTGVVAAATGTNIATTNATNAVAATGAAATNAAAATAAATRSTGGNDWITLAIWAAVLGALLAFLWSKGYLVRIRNYFAETQEELKKCSWPSREELKGSTVVVLVTTALLGLFTVGVDWVLSNLMRLIT